MAIFNEYGEYVSKTSYSKIINECIFYNNNFTYNYIPLNEENVFKTLWKKIVEAAEFIWKQLVRFKDFLKKTFSDFGKKFSEMGDKLKAKKSNYNPELKFNGYRFNIENSVRNLNKTVSNTISESVLNLEQLIITDLFSTRLKVSDGNEYVKQSCDKVIGMLLDQNYIGGPENPNLDELMKTFIYGSVSPIPLKLKDIGNIDIIIDYLKNIDKDIKMVDESTNCFRDFVDKAKWLNEKHAKSLNMNNHLSSHLRAMLLQMDSIQRYSNHCMKAIKDRSNQYLCITRSLLNNESVAEITFAE